MVTHHSDLKKTGETPKGASDQKQPPSCKPVQTSRFIFLLKAYPCENEPSSKKLSDPTFYSDLVVGALPENVAGMFLLISVASYLGYHDAEFSTHFDSLKRI